MVNMKDLLNHAYKNRYAVGAFEIVSLEFLHAVLDAAEKNRSPVILNIVETHFALFDVETLLVAVVHAANRASIPVCVQMDHCSSMATVETAIRLGCNGVMYDNANDDFTVNVGNTREAVSLAHACGITVEGEIGVVTGITSEPSNNKADPENVSFTSVNEAKLYVERTSVDFLAVSVGTVHGRSKNKARLDYTRLAQIRDSVSIPLVIHGGTGLSDHQYHKLIDHGVAKINYFTALKEQATRQIKSNMKKPGANYSGLFKNVSQGVSAEVERCMQAWGCAGRAAEVMLQCATWRTAKRIVVYNTHSDDPGLIRKMLVEGKQQLSVIPGVLCVEHGESVDTHGKYTYCWVIRFASEKAIRNFQSDPGQINFTRQYLTPNADQIITRDYELRAE